MPPADALRKRHASPKSVRSCGHPDALSLAAMKRITASAAALAAFALVFAAPSVSAHHGQFAAYQMDETIKLEGVIKDVRWENPHVYVAMDVKGAGGVETWNIELSSINTMEQGGAKREALKTGERIVVTGHRRRDTKLLILPRTITRPDNSTLIAVPVRRSIFGEPQEGQPQQPQR